MRKRFYLGISVCMLTSLWIAGCTDKKTEIPKNAYADEPANLVIFGQVGNTEEVWNERFGNALKQHFPKYTFTYIQQTKENTLDNMILTGQPVDLIHDSLGGMPTNIISKGYQYDLTPLIKKHAVDLDRFEPNVLKSMMVGNELYGFPLHDGGLVLYYNKDLFNRFGVPYPKDGLTWDEAITLGKRMNRYEDNIQYLGLGVSVSHLLSMNPFSVPFVNPATGKAAFNNSMYRDIIETAILNPMDDGYKKYLTSLNRGLNNNDFMKQKNVAMFVMNFYLQLQPDFETMNWDMVSLPVFKAKPGIGTQPYPNALFITNTSKHKDQAMEVLKFMSSDEMQTKLSKQGWVPVLKNKNIRNVFAEETPFKDKNMINAVFTNTKAAPGNASRFDSQISAIIVKNINSIIFKGIDLNTALRTAEEEANLLLDAATNK